MKGQDLLAGAARAATYNMALQVSMNRLYISLFNASFRLVIGINISLKIHTFIH